MALWLFRLGAACARHPWRVVGCSLVVVALVVAAGVRLGGEPSDSFDVPGTESSAALELLAERFPDQAGASAEVVFATPGAPLTDSRDVVDEALGRLRATDGVASVIGPFSAPPGVGGLSDDGSTGLARVQLDRPIEDVGPSDLAAIEAALGPARDTGVRAEVGGQLPQYAGRSEPGRTSEAIGIAAAVVVLLVAFGSVAAMGLPISMALASLAVGISATWLWANWLDVNSVAPILVSMIGIAVGVDYSLFVVTRHRQQLARGMGVVDSVATATATSGLAVVFAGGTVVVAILGLAIAGIPFVTALGVVTATVVAVAVIFALTLLPALLGLLGSRIDALSLPFVDTSADDDPAGGSERWSARWSRQVTSHPWPWFVGGLLLLVVLAAPTLAIRLGFPDAGTAPPDSTRRQAYELISEGFGPGMNGPLVVVADLRGVDVALPSAPDTADPDGGGTDGDSVSATGGAGAPSALSGLLDQLRGRDDVAAVSPPVPSGDGDTVLLQVVPTSSPQSAQTEALLTDLRGSVAPQVEQAAGARVLIGGTSASFLDVSDRLSGRLLPFIGVVLVLSVLLLVLVMRSIVVPLKAAALNLLSIGAAYGVVVVAFQWGWFTDLLGVPEPIPIAPYVPMMMFAVLFGLSMDYEVFILSRIREDWLATGEPTGSVVRGLSATARVVTSAALIMVIVFASFVLQDATIVKLFGVGLAVAVFLDATVVRLVLVPSFMELVGKANWWFPSRLDAVLPPLDLEGTEGLPTSGQETGEPSRPR